MPSGDSRLAYKGTEIALEKFGVVLCFLLIFLNRCGRKP